MLHIMVPEFTKAKASEELKSSRASRLQSQGSWHRSCMIPDRRKLKKIDNRFSLQQDVGQF